MKVTSISKKARMKYLATVSLMLSFGSTGIYAQPGLANITVSGTAAASTIDLRSGAPTSEYQLAGSGAQGQFSLRVVSTGAAAPQQSNTCSGPTKIFFPTLAGAGVFRFDDGSLLKAHLTGGSDCIDFSLQQALCIRVFEITGGTGRFSNASGSSVTLTMTVVPVLADASNNPVFFAVTGNIAGTVPRGATDQALQEGQP